MLLEATCEAPTCRIHQPPSLLKHPLETEAPTPCMQVPTYTQIGTQYSLLLVVTLPDINLVLFRPWPMYKFVSSHSTHSTVTYFYHHSIILLSTLCPLHTYHTLLDLISLHMHLQPFTKQHWLSLGVFAFFLGTLALSQ